MYGSLSLPVSEIRRLLLLALSTDKNAAERLNVVLASVSKAVDALPYPLRYEAIRTETKTIAALVEPDTMRADVEKLFPQTDGGMSALSATRYYREPEVMIEVSYDQNGGNWKPSNCVTGPLRIYRSSFHAG